MKRTLLTPSRDGAAEATELTDPEMDTTALLLDLVEQVQRIREHLEVAFPSPSPPPRQATRQEPPHRPDEGREDESGDLITAREVMQLLRYPSVDAVYQARRRGQLPFHRLGGRLLFSRKELLALVLRP